MLMCISQHQSVSCCFQNNVKQLQLSRWFLNCVLYWCVSVFFNDFLSRFKRLLSVTFTCTVISLQQAAKLKLPVVINLAGQGKFSRLNRIKLLASEIFLWTFGCLEENQILTDHVSVSGGLNNQSDTTVPDVIAHIVWGDKDVVMVFCNRGNAASV